jgi:hypothetical protein
MFEKNLKNFENKEKYLEKLEKDREDLIDELTEEDYERVYKKELEDLKIKRNKTKLRNLFETWKEKRMNIENEAFIFAFNLK